MSNPLNIEKNFTITFNNTQYPINKELFCYYSPKLKDEILNQQKKTIDLTDSSFLDSSFATFVKACQNKSYSINTSNFYDVRDLSFKYGVQKVIDECNEFQHYCSFIDLLIPHLLYKIRKHGDPQNIIKKISTHFSDLYYRKDLLSVPLEYLEQIIKMSLTCKTDQSMIFRFLITIYEQNEKVVSFFQMLDPNKLDVYELKWILDHSEVDASFISSHYDINQNIKTINDQIKERQEKIDNYAQSLQNLSNSNQYHHVSKNIRRLKDKYIKKSDTDEETADIIESENSLDCLQDIKHKIDAIFAKENGIYELEKNSKENETQIPYITENMADDLEFNFHQILQSFEEIK